MDKNKTYHLFTSSGCLTSKAIADYLEGKLSGSDKLPVEKHAESCDFCNDALEGISFMGEPNRINDITNEINQKIDNKMSDAKIKDKNTITGRVIYFSVAASILLAIGLFFIFNYKTNSLQVAEQVEKKEKSKLSSSKNKKITTKKETEGLIPSEEEVSQPKKNAIADKKKKNIFPNDDSPTISHGSLENIESIEEKSDDPDDSREEANISSMETEERYYDSESLLSDHTNEKLKKTVEDTDISTSNKDKATKAEKLQKKSDYSASRNKTILKRREKSISRSAKKQSPAPYASEDEIEQKSSESPQVIGGYTSSNLVEKTNVFLKADEMPRFKGGDTDQFQQFIQQKIDSSSNNFTGIEGKVHVSFIIDENGNIDQATITKGLSKEINEYALDLVNASPRWKPALNNGIKVKVKVNITLFFPEK